MSNSMSSSGSAFKTQEIAVKCQDCQSYNRFIFTFICVADTFIQSDSVFCVHLGVVSAVEHILSCYKRSNTNYYLIYGKYAN